MVSFQSREKYAKLKESVVKTVEAQIKCGKFVVIQSCKKVAIGQAAGEA